MLKLLSHSEEDTKKYAKHLASFLKSGDIIILSGNLGSGKTKFTEGILDFYGLSDEISSPTFTIVNEHYASSTKIYHFDVYRLCDIDEFFAIGGEDYFCNGICIIEWGEMLEKILPKQYLKILFESSDENSNLRYLYFEPHGDRFENIVERMGNS